MGKHGLPSDAIATRGLTEREINIEMNQRNRTDKASTYRPKDETPAEKAERKKAIKEERRVCIYLPVSDYGVTCSALDLEYSIVNLRDNNTKIVQLTLS